VLSLIEFVRLGVTLRVSEPWMAAGARGGRLARGNPALKRTKRERPER
jgi:hypothetical protein